MFSGSFVVPLSLSSSFIVFLCELVIFHSNRFPSFYIVYIWCRFLSCVYLVADIKHLIDVIVYIKLITKFYSCTKTILLFLHAIL